jgi:glycosyltransferase involved in cell wall biosynthesis
MSGNGGIARYASQFYHYVLQPLGYEFLDSITDPADVLSLVSSKDIVHVEAGIFSHREQEIIRRMLESSYNHVRITMHDPPLFRYPSIQTRSTTLNLMVKYRDRFLGGQRRFRHLLEKAERLYVLSSKGQDAVRNSIGLRQVSVLPHIVPNPMQPGPRPDCPDFMYMGFIGKNKGLEYALEVHAHFQKKYPDTQFRIAGTAIGDASSYLDALAARKLQNVQFLGYVPEPQLTELCSRSAFAFQPFRPYRGYVPVSGSILYCMEKGTLVLSRPVNAIPEIITDGWNGVLLSGKQKQDAKILEELWSDKHRYESIRLAAYQNLLKHHTPEAVAGKLIN